MTIRTIVISFDGDDKELKKKKKGTMILGYVEVHCRAPDNL